MSSSDIEDAICEYKKKMRVLDRKAEIVQKKIDTVNTLFIVYVLFVSVVYLISLIVTPF